MKAHVRKSIHSRKPLAQVHGDAASTGLRRSLGPIQLMLLGIGCIIGAGVYVMTGTAAASYAGPAVVLSFLIAGLGCGFVGLCYAELASVLPVSGASYTYAYASLGEFTAWALGWMLMLEFGLSSAALAVGLSGYFVSLLKDFGFSVSETVSGSLIRSVQAPDGLHLIIGHDVNLIALAALIIVTLILMRGIVQSAAVTAILVVIKVGVLIGFVMVGSRYIDSSNWTPFIPANEGGFRYGLPGIVRAASVVFFAYLGFEAVATAASEARKPQRDVPIGIVGALVVSTVIYIAVSLVMTGLVSYKSLGVADPVAVAVSAIGMPALSIIIKGGALAGLSSVLLVNNYAHSRICFAMSNDGLLPPVFSQLHLRFQTPARGTAVIALIVGVAAATLPIEVLADLVSIGTTFVFIVVAIAVMWLRTTQPDAPRPFSVPLGGLWIRGFWIGTVPVAAILLCLLMMVPVILDVILRAFKGDWIPAAILGIYILLGAVTYARYGAQNSRIRNPQLAEAGR